MKLRELAGSRVADRGFEATCSSVIQKRQFHLRALKQYFRGLSKQDGHLRTYKVIFRFIVTRGGSARAICRGLADTHPVANP